MNALAKPGNRQIRLTPYRTCIVCGGRRLVELVGRRDLALETEFREELFRSLEPPGMPDYMLKDQAFPTQTYPARLVECDSCGVVARDPHLSGQSSVEEYAGDQYHPDWLESSFGEFRSAFEPRMPDLVEWVGPKARVLEVGSFVGGFLAAARDAGWDAVGVDVGRCVSEFARDKGLDVRVGTLADAQLADESFDAVFVWCCFDQLPDPLRDLLEIERVLVQDGKLILRVPNADFVKSARALLHGTGNRLEGATLRALAFSGLAGFPFQVGYTPATLRGVLEEAGFGNVQVRNQINLRGRGADRGSPWAIPEKARALRRVHALSQLVYYASLGSSIRGPWIEALCSKDGAWAYRPLTEGVEDLSASSTLHLPLPRLAT